MATTLEEYGKKRDFTRTTEPEPQTSQGKGPLTFAVQKHRARSLHYWGRKFGLPPGVPGGGITGVLPPPGGGVVISGSTPTGGQMTPSDLESCSPGSCAP